MQRETKSARLEVRIFPSVKAEAEEVAASRRQSLSDWTVDLIAEALRREKRKKRPA